MKSEIMKDSYLRKNFFILIILNLSLLSFALIYTLLFSEGQEYSDAVDCFVRERFSFYCPGCGGTRSLKAFLTFDFYSSFLLYPPIPIAAAAVISYDTRLILTLVKRDKKYTDGYKFLPFLISAASIIITFILRNILLYFGIDTLGNFT